MSVPIPNYLKNLAILKQQKKTWTTFSVKCPCGCNHFLVFQNYLNKEEQALEKPYYDALTQIYCPSDSKCVKYTKDESGVVHYWNLYEPDKGFQGRHEEIVVPQRPFFSGIEVIKIKCTDCGEEYMLFDSRIHGYDGMTTETDQSAIEYEPHFKLKCKEAVSLEVKIENDESFDVFQENTDLGFTKKQYADSFSWICIYKINDIGKKTKIFDRETA